MTDTRTKILDSAEEHILHVGVNAMRSGDRDAIGLMGIHLSRVLPKDNSNTYDTEKRLNCLNRNA